MLRFGLFGTGYWAAETHATALAAHPGVRLAGVWGRNPEKAARLARRYDVPAFDDADALIDAVDVVAVALPPDVQVAIALRAATAGRHLLLDKPLALTLPDADRLVAVATGAGVASVVFFTNRFHPDVSAFLAAAAGTGGWYGARCAMFASIFQPGNPYTDSVWRRERGGLWDIGPHALSVILPVLGPVARVSAVSGPRDTTHLMLEHSDGAASTLSLTLDAPPAATIFDVTFFGEEGFSAVPRGAGSSVEAFTQAVDQLLVEVDSGTRDHQCDVRFGRDVVAVLTAADNARSQQRAVAVPD